jgi:histidine ammonia-lyase
MIAQYTAAALASENKVLVHPASADSIPTSANQEDHVSMGPIAGRHARTVLDHVERILAIEVLVAAEALDQRHRLLAAEAGGPGGGVSTDGPSPEPGLGVREAHARVRAVISPLAGDREPGPDLASATRLVHDGLLVDLAGADPAADAPDLARARA